MLIRAVKVGVIKNAISHRGTGSLFIGGRNNDERRAWWVGRVCVKYKEKERAEGLLEQRKNNSKLRKFSYLKT